MLYNIINENVIVTYAYVWGHDVTWHFGIQKTQGKSINNKTMHEKNVRKPQAKKPKTLKKTSNLTCLFEL